MRWNVDQAVEHLDMNAKQHSTGHCAQYVRQAIEAGGITLRRHNSAKDYGDSLIRAGFFEFEPSELAHFQAGDVAVIQGIKGHPHGHMAMFDRKQWVSDFKQRTLYPGNAYRAAKPKYLIYRFPTVVDALPPDSVVA